MNNLKFITLLFLLLLYGCQQNESNTTSAASSELQKIIDEHQDREPYDSKSYPLGLFTADYYKSEAEYASNQIEKLSKINTNS